MLSLHYQCQHSQKVHGSRCAKQGKLQLLTPGTQDNTPCSSCCHNSGATCFKTAHAHTDTHTHTRDAVCRQQGPQEGEKCGVVQDTLLERHKGTNWQPMWGRAEFGQVTHSNCTAAATTAWQNHTSGAATANVQGGHAQRAFMKAAQEPLRAPQPSQPQPASSQP